MFVTTQGGAVESVRLNLAHRAEGVLKLGQPVSTAGYQLAGYHWPWKLISVAENQATEIKDEIMDVGESYVEVSLWAGYDVARPIKWHLLLDEQNA